MLPPSILIHDAGDEARPTLTLQIGRRSFELIRHTMDQIHQRLLVHFLVFDGSVEIERIDLRLERARHFPVYPRNIVCDQ